MKMTNIFFLIWAATFFVVVSAQAVEPAKRSLITARAAIEDLIKTNSSCKKTGDLYWEIGTAQGALLSGAVGSKYNADTVIEIASASKWLFGAFVLEQTKGELTYEQKSFLQMTSGYTNMKNIPCTLDKVKTVKDCFLAKPLVGRLLGRGSNAELSSENKGKFYYNGGHAQALAIKDEIGLADKTRESLAQTVKEKLKITKLSYAFPQLAGGAMSNASSYAEFLRNIMQNKYYISKTLQSEAGICANSKCGAAKVAESPAPEGLNWWYGDHYWIEKTTEGKIEAYSSAGLFGFYPWISADQKYYGIVSRKGSLMQGPESSVLCGRAIREKFLANY